MKTRQDFEHFTAAVLTATAVFGTTWHIAWYIAYSIAFGG